MGKEKSAFELAVGAISRKERTVAELREWLSDRELEEADVEETVDRLISMGGLDDERYARCFAEDKRELSGWGPERIRETLLGRGIERSVAERVAEVETAGAQVERASQLLVKRGEPPCDGPSRARALAFLRRRGYDSEVAYDAIRHVGRTAG